MPITNMAPNGKILLKINKMNKRRTKMLNNLKTMNRFKVHKRRKPRSKKISYKYLGI